MKPRTSGYAYRYDDLNDVYFVRTIDGSNFDRYIPEGLIKQIIAERGNKVKQISDFQKTCHFLDDGSHAFIDLNMRTFTPEEEDMIFCGEKVQPKGIQKVISLFKRKR